MLLVVGLGNPGSEYAAHRHNVGFMTVDEVARRSGAGLSRSKFSGEIVRTSIEDVETLLLKPMTYMNCSGDSVQPCAAFFKIPPPSIIVIHDDLDLPFGTIRLKQGGGHAGHNGLRSIIGRLSTPDFCRVRIGIGRPPPEFQGEVSDYVLSGFRSSERENLPSCLRIAAKSVLDVAARGIEAAMKTRNTRRKKKKAPKQQDLKDGEPTGAPTTTDEPNEGS
ncbi:MAG: aminoacyl-tRNA hydrolase [Deltaproteobacteria bacterium]|nr:MAG: aminoacyl-tRNA hydrolase [Deltaproteobacteria bacterium]